MRVSVVTVSDFDAGKVLSARAWRTMAGQAGSGSMPV